MDARPTRWVVSAASRLAAGFVVLLAGIALLTAIVGDPMEARATRTPSKTVETSVETFGQYTELDPPPAGMSPSLSHDEAVSAADRMNFAHASGVTASFGVFTGGGSASLKDGTTAPIMDHVPAWVVTYANDCPTSPGRPLPPDVCTTDWHVVVDDATGKAMDSWNQ